MTIIDSETARNITALTAKAAAFGFPAPISFETRVLWGKRKEKKL